ncbi:OmpP1/FadL family transporter [Calditerrivibrio nitroreducens]|uniref:Membrane protein involved in aromatic hydrocarbon degradation n=1 Tax=Calditerrivibrio nitroreducens (strain DSM 19672 / NBRC 101217 / Yu37-1) TaxID=768670 RepID=E4TK02_CALNY|nr:outer membrane protein transport protein [Calditerrivibrio nitroreducens]ADR18253.1 membrane protein involved in aromatic hydrocarbon degradation [Calditerrivibrio nitroreducens DSM 19672]
MRKLLVALSIIGITSGMAYSNGFQINEQGAKALGMGGAFVAQADDPSAVYFNPAGITQLEGTQFSLGASPIAPMATFDSDGKTTALTGKGNINTDGEKQIFYIPNFYLTRKIGDNFAFGVGIFSNFGLATDWPDDWEGRFTTTNAEITTISLNPVLAYKISDKLSIAAGVVVQKIDVTLENRVILGFNPPSSITTEGHTTLEADSHAYGWNVGLLFKPTENLSIGASYRSRIKQKLDGTATTDNVTSGALVDKDNGHADLTLPDIAYIGLAWTNKTWTFELDGQWTGWSSYEKFQVDFDTAHLGKTQIVKPKHWKDVWAIRFGTQYKLNDTVSLRAGIIRDYSPIDDEYLDPLVPSGDRWLYAAGIGLNFGNLTVDLAYNYLQDEERRYDNFNGDIYAGSTKVGHVTGTFKDVHAHIFGVNVSYKF